MSGTSKPPVIEPWMRALSRDIVDGINPNPVEAVTLSVDVSVKIARAYASERARLRRELQALAEKYPNESCAYELRALIDRELPEQKETLGDSKR